MPMGIYPRPSLEQRFEQSYLPEPNSGCWLWTKAIHKNTGYGCIRINGKHGLAHRASWILFNGAIPLGLNVLHKCDVRCCVNPDHLFLGTAYDNREDAKRKDRIPIGERHWNSKLTAADVKSIRNGPCGGSWKATAKHYDVTYGTLCDIRAKRTWQHI